MNNENELKRNTFTMIDINGNKLTCYILFTFDSDETGKSYIVYTDNSKDDKGNTQVYAGTYDPAHMNDEFLQLGDIETDKEWKVIETILSSIQEEVKRQQAEGTGTEGSNEQ